MAPETGGSARKVTIIADCRERQSKTCQWLRSLEAEVVEKQLEVADYIVSDRVGIERKTVEDFLESVINGRIFSQLENLAASFERPLLILEGDQRSLFTTRNMHPNSIHGALTSIAVDHGIPIIWTHSPQATAAQIYWTGYREQFRDKRGNGGRACRKLKTVPEHQEFLVSGLPNVNSKLSRRLLSHFGTAKRVFSASEERLMKVEGIGKKKARSIWCLLNEKYGTVPDGEVEGKAEEKR
jgi:ERCC4-type nuclease